MGLFYYRAIFGVRRPKVALLCIGEEEMKGNDLTRETYGRLKQLPLNFIGNIEGREVFSGSANVIVCDGFIGNVTLKVSEGAAQHIVAQSKKALQQHPGFAGRFHAVAQRVQGISQGASTTRNTAGRRCSESAESPSSDTADRTPTPSKTPCAWPQRWRAPG